MRYGDISNEIAPAVILNIDTIGEIKSRFGGLKKDFVLHKAFSLSLYRLFKRDIGIYIICEGDFFPMAKRIEEALEYQFFPFTRFYAIEEAEDLSELIQFPHVMRYYYRYESIHVPFTSIVKHRKIMHLDEILEDLGSV